MWKRDPKVIEAKEKEKRIKNFHKEKDFSREKRAELYEDLAKSWLNAKKPRKAIKSYEQAVKNWGEAQDIETSGHRYGALFESHIKTARQYRTNKEKDLRNIKRLKKVLKGDWYGLEGKTISITLGIVGVFLLTSSGNLITGNVIGNLSNTTSNILGIVLILGALGLFVCRRKK